MPGKTRHKNSMDLKASANEDIANVIRCKRCWHWFMSGIANWLESNGMLSSVRFWKLARDATPLRVTFVDRRGPEGKYIRSLGYSIFNICRFGQAAEALTMTASSRARKRIGPEMINTSRLRNWNKGACALSLNEYGESRSGSE